MEASELGFKRELPRKEMSPSGLGLASTFAWAVCFDLLAYPFCLGPGGVGRCFTEEVQRLNLSVKLCIQAEEGLSGCVVVAAVQR